MDENISNITPADLRGILNYVPRFLGQTFVISLDGSIIDNENLPNILLDIAVLRSLQIKVVIVHGIGKQIAELSADRNIEISNVDGSGPTDPVTLDLAIRASSRTSHQILEALTQTGLKCAITNSIRSTPIGVLKGVDHQRSGKIDRIDAEFLNHLIAQDIIPIIQPIGFDRNGHTLRINSDLLAIETAFALKATKAIFVTELDGLTIDGELKRQLPVSVLESKLADDGSFDDKALSKAKHALTGVKGGISRIHILDGNIHDGLVREVFSNEGVGTLVYGNEYQQIRQAQRSDITRIYHLTSGSVEKEELARRSIESIESEIGNFYVYEIDGNLIGCVLISLFDEAPDTAEINALFVHSLHQRQGIGSKLAKFACHKAEENGSKQILALSTQSFSFFQSVCGFQETDINALPESRRQAYQQQNRQSKILIKDLN
ncbi:MAG: amino-acid N-acetyltransferase [Verrucomicrobiia bacterium]